MSSHDQPKHFRSWRDFARKVDAVRRPPTRQSRARLGISAFSVSGIVLLTLTAFVSQPAAAAPTAINLGTASNFAVLAGSTITNTGSTVISGDIGLAPGTAVTGFPPGVQSSGTTLVADAQALAAQNDLTTAFLNTAGSTPATTAPSDLGGSTLTPGIYASSTSMALTGSVTLNGGGDASAVFIFQAGSTLTTASGSSVILENGAQACNVFWEAGSSVTLGTTSNMSGTIMSLSSATMNTGATVTGRVLARNGAVTLDDNVINVPTCLASTGTTTTTVGSTTTTKGTTTTTTKGTTKGTTTKSTTTTTRGPTTRAKGTTTTTTTPVIPVGAPATGFGGTAGSGPTPFAPIGLGAVGLAAAAGAAAVLTRRRHARNSGGAPNDSPPGT